MSRMDRLAVLQLDKETLFRTVRGDLQNEDAMEALERIEEIHNRFREELMRCGTLAISDRLDGSIGKRAADHIRRIAYETCWPDEDAA